ncbi:MAG: class I SAM-dependent methyltransferase, partial [Candidatus Eremiobacteraeota bacterium]|nr:class I SAM-dependent methyltransferase [Candidatus Eremiobacteraeota bacterium]
LEFKVGDGRSLPGVAAESLDLVFSFESLVHAEDDVMAAYLQAISTALKPGGAAFLHHSNLGQHLNYFRRTDWLPKSWRRPLKRAGLLDFGEWRAHSMTADRFLELCGVTGLHCSHQELIPWGGKRLIDCFSTVVKDQPQGPPSRLENTGFIARAYAIQRVAGLYCADVPW